MQKKKLVIFDFDGVIEDTFELSFGFFREQFPNLTHDEYRTWFDDNFYKVIKEKNISINVGAYYRKYDTALKKREISPNIKKALESLHGDFSLAVVSSSFDGTLIRYLKRNGISHIFDHVWGATVHKSKVEKLKGLMNVHAVEPDQCRFITDTLGDIREAWEAGIQSIAVTWGFHPRERLESGHPAAIVATPQELMGYLEKNF